LGWITELAVRGFRQARRLFHLLVGLVFLFLAAGGGIVSWQEWLEYRQAPAQWPIRFGVVAAFTVLLIIMGLYSFAKARSVR
jgi:divalent metal cation (Fe/Co/Zn/Cd) transporter